MIIFFIYYLIIIKNYKQFILKKINILILKVCRDMLIIFFKRVIKTVMGLIALIKLQLFMF